MINNIRFFVKFNMKYYKIYYKFCYADFMFKSTSPVLQISCPI